GSVASIHVKDHTLCLNQTIKDWYTSLVTLSETKGLSERFFAALRMTTLYGHLIKCTNVIWFDLATDDERRRWGMIDFKRTIILKRTLDDPFFWVLLQICNTTACPHARIRSFGTGVIRGI